MSLYHLLSHIINYIISFFPSSLYINFNHQQPLLSYSSSSVVNLHSSPKYKRFLSVIFHSFHCNQYITYLEPAETQITLSIWWLITYAIIFTLTTIILIVYFLKKQQKPQLILKHIKKIATMSNKKNQKKNIIIKSESEDEELDYSELNKIAQGIKGIYSESYEAGVSGIVRDSGTFLPITVKNTKMLTSHTKTQKYIKSGNLSYVERKNKRNGKSSKEQINQSLCTTPELDTTVSSSDSEDFIAPNPYNSSDDSIIGDQIITESPKINNEDERNVDNIMDNDPLKCDAPLINTLKDSIETFKIPPHITIKDSETENFNTTMFTILSYNQKLIAQHLIRMNPQLLIQNVEESLPTPKLHSFIRDLTERYPGSSACTDEQKSFFRTQIDMIGGLSNPEKDFIKLKLTKDKLHPVSYWQGYMDRTMEDKSITMKIQEMEHKKILNDIHKQLQGTKELINTYKEKITERDCAINLLFKQFNDVRARFENIANTPSMQTRQSALKPLMTCPSILPQPETRIRKPEIAPSTHSSSSTKQMSSKSSMNKPQVSAQDLKRHVASLSGSLELAVSAMESLGFPPDVINKARQNWKSFQPGLIKYLSKVNTPDKMASAVAKITHNTRDAYKHNLISKTIKEEQQ